MNKQSIAWAVAGLVAGAVIFQLFFSYGYRCGPKGMMEGEMMSQGMMGQSMMHGSSAMGSGSTMMSASDTDKAFLEEMVPHHQAAIDMARLMKANTKRPEMQKLAEDIIKAQTEEINQMRAWHAAWY